MNDNGGLSASDVALLTGNNNGFGGNGGWSELIWLFAIIALMNGGWGGGFGGGFGGGYANMQLGYDFPWLLNGQNGINNNVSDGFRISQLQDSVSSVRNGISDLSTQLCGGFGNVQTALANGFAGNVAAINSAAGDIQNGLCNGFATTNSNIANASTDIQMGLANGFAGVNATIANGTNGIQMGLANGFANTNSNIANAANGTQMALANGFANTSSAINGAQNALSQQLYVDQISDLERSYAAQTAVAQGMNGIQGQLAQCCCDNRAATADLKYTIATENCADRTAAYQNTRDIIESQNRGIQTIMDKLCQLELDGVKGQLAQAQRENVGLQNQVNMAAFRESQANQNALFAQGMTNEVDALYNRLKNCPVNTVPVYGNQPIFTCPGTGCGCGNNNGLNL